VIIGPPAWDGLASFGNAAFEQLSPVGFVPPEGRSISVEGDWVRFAPVVVASGVPLGFVPPGPVLNVGVKFGFVLQLL